MYLTMERVSVRRLFSACDVNRTGRIEYKDFTAVCRELNVPEADIQTLFDRFDPSAEGYIDYCKFSSKFEEVWGTVDLAPHKCPWEEFVARTDAASLLPDSFQEQLCDLYQALHSGPDPLLLQQYEKTIHSLLTHIMDYRLEAEQLQHALTRAEELKSSQLLEVEEYIQQQLSRTEARVREEERLKKEGIMAALKTKHTAEVKELHATLDTLLKSQEETKLTQSKEARLNKQISALSLENEEMRASLIQAQTYISVLHSELDQLKNMCADQKAQSHRDAEKLRRMVDESQSYSEHLQILQKMNQQLYDSNDSLRSALAGEVVSAKRRRSPRSERPDRRIRPLRQSTLNHSSSLVVDGSQQRLWPVDSGVSLPMDSVGSPVSNYDSDDSRESHYASDVEVSEIMCEADQSVALSRTSSMRSSFRRRLSAFSTKLYEADIVESEEPAPMYRLVLAGDAGAGKSSFLLRLTLNEFRGDIPTTLGVDFQTKKMLVDGKKTSLQIWDTAGQERFRSMARAYFRKAHGILLLYDVTSESSFLNIRAWMDQIQDSAEEKIPMCVIGNKLDLREALPENSCVSTQHGEKLAQAYGALFCETSAKEGTNVVEAVLHLAREVKKSVRVRTQSQSEVRLSQTVPKKTESRCCGLKST